MKTLMLWGQPVTNIGIADVNFRDYPDFCDAHFDYAEWANTGMKLTDLELDELTQTYPEVVNEMANEYMWDAAESAYDFEMDR